MNRCVIVLLVVVATSRITSSARAEDDEARKAYLARRAAEHAAAEKAVRELSARDYGTLMPDEFIRLAYAYNELGDNRLALDAVCRVSDDVLAKLKQLDLKITCFHNMASSDDKTIRIRELAFIDRCLDKKYGNQGIWLWRKAKCVCQTSVATAIPTVGDVIGSEARIIDREQYEYSFELLRRAFEVEPKLLELSDVGADFLWAQDFPRLSEEPRFKALMKK